MAVRRIVANIAAGDPAAAKRFYGDLLGLDVAMDFDWIVTYAADTQARVQLSVMSEGGSGTPVPDLSIEVDDVDLMLERAITLGFRIEYGPADEDWGVRRFYTRDPYGRLVNILTHRS